ncbi:MAG TPA: glycosyltransferase family 2 protein [Bacteroidota bacterium]|nr:glycosyltransferase family 2 protein [Bacteroidota bacterium]
MIKNKKLILVVPAYNEEGKIGEVVRKAVARAPMLDKILVVDDGSKDNTSEEAREAGAEVLKHAANTGAGGAIRTGCEYAAEHGYDIIVVIAGDDQDDPSFVESLVRPIVDEDYDFIQGSRYLYGKLDIPKFRLITTRGYSLVFSLAARKWITDASNGFRAYKTSILQTINLRQKWLEQYELEPYLLLQSIKKGFKFKEVPVPKYWPKGKSYSKMVPFKSWWSISRPIFYSMIQGKGK